MIFNSVQPITVFFFKKKNQGLFWTSGFLETVKYLTKSLQLTKSNNPHLKWYKITGTITLQTESVDCNSWQFSIVLYFKIDSVFILKKWFSTRFVIISECPRIGLKIKCKIFISYWSLHFSLCVNLFHLLEFSPFRL